MQATSMHEPPILNASVPVPCKQLLGIKMLQHVVLLTISSTEFLKASHLYEVLDACRPELS